MKRDDRINRRLRESLAKNGVSLAEAARRCNMCYTTFYRAVSGLRPIYADEVTVMARAAGTDPLMLLGWDEV